MKQILFYLVMCSSLIMAQSWKTTVDLCISAGSSERISLFSNKAGNHLLVQKSNQLNYYLYKYDGTLVRATTLDTYSESKRLNIVTGNADKIYAIYKKGSTIISKRSTDDGITWTALNSINMSNSVSDGLAAIADDNFAYLSWSEKQGASSRYESYYMDIDHTQSGWTDYKQVTDESGIEGGEPSITLASNRITVVFTREFFGGGNIYNRDIYNGVWQNTSFAAPGIQGFVIDDNSKSHVLSYEAGDSQPGDPTPYSLTHYTAGLGASNWTYQGVIKNYGYGGYLPPEEKRLNSAKSNDNFIHIVYGGSTYKKWNGTQFTDTFTFGNGDNNKISANGNDLYVVWIENNSIKLRQRDFAPLLPASFAGSWDNGDPETGHPKLTWAANTEMDLKEYEVWKKVDDWYGNNIEPWAKKTATTNTSYVDNSEIGWDYMANPRVVYYKIRAIDQSNNASGYTATQRFDCNNGPHGNSARGELVAETALPKSFKLQSNYPNPFNPVTSIRYALPEASSVVLNVYSLSGQKVATLQNGLQQAGRHTARFDGSSLASGIYIYRFSAVGQKSGKRFKAVKRMLLIK